MFVHAGKPMSGRSDASVMDAPLSIHAPKLIPWMLIEGILIASGACPFTAVQYIVIVLCPLQDQDR